MTSEQGRSKLPASASKLAQALEVASLGLHSSYTFFFSIPICDEIDAPCARPEPTQEYSVLLLGYLRKKHTGVRPYMASVVPCDRQSMRARYDRGVPSLCGPFMACAAPSDYSTPTYCTTRYVQIKAPKTKTTIVRVYV